MENTENERLRILQKELGFKSQAEFANRFKLKQGALSNIYRKESGRKIPSKMKLQLQKEFGVNLDWLENGNGLMFVEGVNVSSGVGAMVGKSNRSIVNNIGLDGHHNIIGPDGRVNITPIQPQTAAEMLADNEALRRENAEKDHRIAELKETIASQKETIDRLFKMLDNK